MAWMCAVVFLDFNGTEMLHVDQDEAYKLVIEVAAGSLEDVDMIARRLRGLHEAM
jgi:death-on-curing protein